MNNRPSLFFLTAALCLGFGPQTGDTRNLVVEPNHSTIQFSVPISGGLTRITGKFTEFTIDIGLVDNDITKSQIRSSIKVNSINTGISARDEDLKTKTFFDAATFPEVTFVSERISKVKDGFIAQGLFTMHGITKSIELPFSITGRKDDVIGFASRYSIKRTDFDLGTSFKHTTEDNFIGNEIGIEIDFWTKKPKVKK